MTSRFVEAVRLSSEMFIQWLGMIAVKYPFISILFYMDCLDVSSTIKVGYSTRMAAISWVQCLLIESCFFLGIMSKIILYSKSFHTHFALPFCSFNFKIQFKQRCVCVCQPECEHPHAAEHFCSGAFSNLNSRIRCFILLKECTFCRGFWKPARPTEIPWNTLVIIAKNPGWFPWGLFRKMVIFV